ncbi:MAG: methyltransferase family protein [Nitrospinales bacterium]
MWDLASFISEYGFIWIVCNFSLFLVAFIGSLYINFNFNMIMVGLIYLLPLIPLGYSAENADRFLIVSIQNTLFGLLELFIFAVTVKGGDATFDKEHIKQLFGHTLPIAVALIGLSYVSRATNISVSSAELMVICSIFFVGFIMRALAVYQIGKSAFKFDIVFRREQKLKEDQLYSLCRHPSYTAMMIVILAYAITTHSWIIGALGLLSAWFGFQYRIYHEELALKNQFGDEYIRYRNRTSMWFPNPFKSSKGSVN